jgi:hypothetical protein
MGDHELMTLAFRLDLGLYYFGVVALPFKHGPSALKIPSFASPHSRLPARLIALYNRRFAQIARARLRRGTWGKSNAGRYFGFTSYQLDRSLLPRVLKALAAWLWLELREGWRTWFRAPIVVPERSVRPPRAAAPMCAATVAAAAND